MSTIWFIRHAESETNIGLPTLSPLTAELTVIGKEQARCIANALVSSPQLVITSSYLRTKQTAVPTLLRFPTARHEEWPVHEFTYLSQSIGRENTTIDERRILVNNYWSRLDHQYIDGDGAESFSHFMQRVRNVLDQLKLASEDFIVVFSHGQFILAVLSWLMGLIFDNMRQFRYFLLAHEIPNGAIMKTYFHDNGEVWFSPFLTSHLPPLTPP